MKSCYWGITFCEESQTFVHNMAQTARQWPQVTTEGGQAGGEGWGNGGSHMPFPTPHPLPGWRQKEEGKWGGGGVRAFSLPSPCDPAKAALPQQRRHHLAALLTFR